MSGYLAGAVFGAGVAAIGWWAMIPGPPLKTRVLPYTDQGWTPRRAALPAVRFFFRILDALGSSRASVERRTTALGTLTPRDFRVRQIRNGALGAAIGIIVASLGVVRGIPVAVSVMIPLFAIFVGVLLSDQLLSRRLARRDAQVGAELPDIAQLLSLAVGAGQSMLSALSYVSSIGRGPLSREIARTVGAVHAGDPVPVALKALARRVNNPALHRFCDALLISFDQGTALASTLQTQAEDAREYQRRQLLEKGGKKEITMMVPVVFLILPITVIFALYPGIASLTFI